MRYVIIRSNERELDLVYYFNGSGDSNCSDTPVLRISNDSPK